LRIFTTKEPKEPAVVVTRPSTINERKPADPDFEPPIKPTKENDETYTEDDIHIVFSTGCNLFQHWQAEVVLYSHLKVGQRGKITRVVSGCDTENQKRVHGKFLTQ